MDDFGLLAEAAGQIGTDDRVASVDFVVDRFTDVVQKAGALRGGGVEPEFGGDHARQVGDFEAVVQDVLAVARTVAQAAEGAHEFGMQVVHAGIEGGLLAGLLDLLVHEALGLFVHFLDARGMDAPVGDEVFHRDPSDFAAHRVEAADRHAFGGVVDDQVGAGELFEGADVAAFATDDAALEVVRGNVDGRHGHFCRMVGGDALDGDREDLASRFIGFCLGARLGIADDSGGFMGDFVAQVVEQLSLGLVRGHAGDFFQALVDFLETGVEGLATLVEFALAVLQVAVATVELPLHARELMLAGVERITAVVKRVFTAVETFLGGTRLLQALGLFGFDGLTKLERFVLGFDFSLFLERVRLLARFLNERVCLALGVLLARIVDCPNDDDADDDADGKADHEPEHFRHTLPLSCCVRSIGLGHQKMPGLHQA